MKKYIGESNYSETNHVRNFCLYWIKASKGSGDEWRKENDLDCLYFNGDLRADTLISAWTPIKWVADFLNKDKGKKFYKYRKNAENPCADLELLAEKSDMYLPKNHPMVKLLERFLALAELRCNFILLPDRKMNCDRYHMNVEGEDIWLFDSVPATLYHIFNEHTMGQYFKDISPKAWIKREHLYVAFYNRVIDVCNIIPMPGYDGEGSAEWLTDEKSICNALDYMRMILEFRNAELFECKSLEYIYSKLVEREGGYIYIQDLNSEEQDMRKVYVGNIHKGTENVGASFANMGLIFDNIYKEYVTFDGTYISNGRTLKKIYTIDIYANTVSDPYETIRNAGYVIKWD